MAGKLSLLVGFGAGYVLGARAGRERYDRLTSRARTAWQDPRVQQRAVRVQNLIPGKLETDHERPHRRTR